MRLASGQPPSAPLVPLPASLNTRHAELSLIASVPPSHRSINSKLTSHSGQQRSTRGERGSSVESSVQDPTKHSRSGGGASYVAARGRMGHHHGGCRCELCGAPAAVHCAADAAFLCAACDAKVHGANFLASRHRRTRLLDLAAAAGAPPPDGYESAAVSSCVSTADSASSSAPPRRRRPRGARAPAGRPTPSTRAEAVLEAWAKRAGLAAGPAALRRAARALRACAHDLASARVPPRVAMAAALWREVAGRSGRGIGGGGCGLGEALRRLEACAHVPARLVVAVAASLARALGRARRRRRAATDAVEGWDECAWAGPRSSPARS